MAGSPEHYVEHKEPYTKESTLWFHFYRANYMFMHLFPTCYWLKQSTIKHSAVIETLYFLIWKLIVQIHFRKKTIELYTSALYNLSHLCNTMSLKSRHNLFFLTYCAQRNGISWVLERDHPQNAWGSLSQSFLIAATPQTQTHPVLH